MKKRRGEPLIQRISKRLVIKAIKQGQSIDSSIIYEKVQAPIATLSSELIDYIISYLNTRDVLNLRETCWFGYLITAPDKIWRDRFYASYGLTEQEVKFMKEDPNRRAFKDDWVLEIKKRIDVRIWITVTPIVMLANEMLESNSYRDHYHMTMHPSFTLYDLIRRIFHREQCDEDNTMIEFHPVSNISVLTDNPSYPLVWSRQDGLYLVNRSIGTCTGGATTCDLLVYLVPVKISKEAAIYPQSIHMKLRTSTTWYLSIQASLSRHTRLVQSCQVLADCSTYDHPLTLEEIQPYHRFLRCYVRKDITEKSAHLKDFNMNFCSEDEEYDDVESSDID